MADVSIANTTSNISAQTVILAGRDQTITGLHTFDRDPSAPFAVTANSAVVSNLDADKVDGYQGSELAVLAEAETVSGAWTFSQAIVSTAVGTHKFGTSGSTSNRAVWFTGTYAASGSTGMNIGVYADHTLTAEVNADAFGMVVTPTITEAASGTHANIASLKVAAPTITNAGAATTNGMSLYIEAAPTGGTNNYALLIASGAAYFGGSVTHVAGVVESSVISPSQITSNQNDYAPTGGSGARVIRLSTDASRTITGLSIGQVAGRRVLLINVGAQDIVFTNDATSTAANRWLTPGAASFTLNTQDAVEIWYDGTSSRWRMVAY